MKFTPVYNIKNKLFAAQSELVYRLRLLQHEKSLPPLEAGDRLILQSLKKEGVYITNIEELGLKSTPELLQVARQHLAQMSADINQHSEKKLPQIYTVTQLPEFANWAKETRLLTIIENYLRFPVTFHGVHLRKDFPNKNQFGTLLWHKDSEDRKMIKIIIYLNDVDENTGLLNISLCI